MKPIQDLTDKELFVELVAAYTSHRFGVRGGNRRLRELAQENDRREDIMRERLRQGYVKVTVRVGGATHVTGIQSEPGDKTLCGRTWWFRCDLGTDYYCQRCQKLLGRVLYGTTSAPPQSTPTKHPGDPSSD
jgi:hypothetical protein